MFSDTQMCRAVLNNRLMSGKTETTYFPKSYGRFRSFLPSGQNREQNIVDFTLHMRWAIGPLPIPSGLKRVTRETFCCVGSAAQLAVDPKFVASSCLIDGS